MGAIPISPDTLITRLHLFISALTVEMVREVISSILVEVKEILRMSVIFIVVLIGEAGGLSEQIYI